MNRNILFVDDEIEIRNTINRQLRRTPYSVFFASDADEALDILDKQVIHLVITDHKMPGTNGVDFLGIVKERWPNIVRMLISGYIETDLLITAINKGEVYRFITKPWDYNELKETIADGLHHYDVLEQNRKLLNKIIESGLFQNSSRNSRGAVLKEDDAFFNEVDYGLIVFDRKFQVKIANSIVKKILELPALKQGENIDAIFPPQIKEFILRGFEENDGQAAEVFSVNGKNLTFRLRSFRRSDDTEKGLVIIHE